MNKTGAICQGVILCSPNRICTSVVTFFRVYSLSVAAAIAFRLQSVVQTFVIMTSCCHLSSVNVWFSFIAVLVCTQTVGYWMDMPTNSSVSPPAPCFRGDRLCLLFSGFPSPRLAEGLLLFLFPSQRKAVIHLRSFPRLSPVPSPPEDWVSCVVLVSCFYRWDKYPPNDPWVKDLSLLRSSGAFRKCDPNERTLGYCRCPLTGTNKTLASLSPLSLLLGHCEVNNFLYPCVTTW